MCVCVCVCVCVAAKITRVSELFLEEAPSLGQEEKKRPTEDDTQAETCVTDEWRAESWGERCACVLDRG